MLIPFSDLLKFLAIPISGIIHIGAHDCEELQTYHDHGVRNILWFDALRSKIDAAKARGLAAYHAVLSNTDGETVTFNVTNNGQSSSILPLGTHLQHHPQVHVVHTSEETTTRFDTLCEKENIKAEQYNFLNLDIQGAELKALHGFGSLLHTVDYIYTEVNQEEVYVGCALIADLDAYLATFGFVRVLTSMTPHKWGDAFYVKSKLL